MPTKLTALAPGDVFAMTLAPSVRGIGRVMRVMLGSAFLVEVFDYTDDGAVEPLTATLEAYGRMFRPLCIGTSSYEKAGWTRLRCEPDYDGGDWAGIGFVLGREAGGVRISRGGSTQVVSEDETEGMEALIMNTPGRIVYMIREQLGLLSQADG